MTSYTYEYDFYIRDRILMLENSGIGFKYDLSMTSICSRGAEAIELSLTSIDMAR